MKQTLRQHLKGLNTKEYNILRSMCHLSKNLYNKTLHEVQEYYSNNGEYLNYYNAWKQIKHNWNYKVLPSQVAQQTMKHVDKAFQSFFKLVEKKREGKYTDDVHPPHYLDKDGFYSLTFPSQSFQVKDDHIRIGVVPSFRNEFDYNITEIQIPFTYEDVKNREIKQLQIIPKADAQYFEYRIIYEIEEELIETKKDTFLAIDLGVDNLATCVDQAGRSFILDGRKLKSLNRWYNKEIARLQGIKDKQGIDGSTKHIKKLFRDRRNRVHDYINKAVHHIVEYCKKHKIGKVFVGDGQGWKQEVSIGDKNNQNFVHIPFDKFKQKLKGKLALLGVEFVLVDESYTSKCSFYDGEPIKHHEEYVGTRVERGLFRTKKGIFVNADVNGALNIARKQGKLETLQGVESSGTVAVPLRIREPFPVEGASIGHCA